MFLEKDKPEVETKEIDRGYYSNGRKVKLKTEKDFGTALLEELIKKFIKTEEEVLKEKIKIATKEIKEIYKEDMKAYKRSINRMFDEFKTSFRNMVKANKDKI